MEINKEELMKQIREDNLKDKHLRCEIIVADDSEAPYIAIKGDSTSFLTEVKFITSLKLLLKQLVENADEDVKDALDKIDAQNLGLIDLN